MDNNHEERLKNLERLVNELSKKLERSIEYSEYLGEELEKSILYSESIEEKFHLNKTLVTRKQKLQRIIDRMKEI